MFRSINRVIIKVVFQLLLYQSIALEELDIFAFEIELIRLVVRPQNPRGKGGNVRAAAD